MHIWLFTRLTQGDVIPVPVSLLRLVESSLFESIQLAGISPVTCTVLSPGNKHAYIESSESTPVALFLEHNKTLGAHVVVYVCCVALTEPSARVYLICNSDLRNVIFPQQPHAP